MILFFLSKNSTTWLNYHMKRQFPGLNFCTPHKATETTIVTSPESALKDIITSNRSLNIAAPVHGTSQQPLGNESTDEATNTSADSPFLSALDQTFSEPSSPDRICLPTTTRQLESFHTAAYIGEEIRAKQMTNDIPWPPSHSDLTIQKCMEFVPPALYNHIALITGNVEHDLIEAGSLSTKHCQVPDSANIKILSICQDIMYAHGKGTKPTPKALALGLTLRHLTGSKHILL